jgi:hypothetical protein
MVALRLLKKFKRFAKSRLVYVVRVVMSIRYLHLRPNSTFSGYYEAHLLVVKNEIYASIAKICVESFLFFNPNSRVVLHVDSATRVASNKALKKSISRKKVTIVQIDSDSLPWQDSKLDLILSLGDPRKFFMDADLKWNGPISELAGITLFVKEFNFSENAFYAPLTNKDWFSEFPNATMKNTSFFYWGGYTPSTEDKESIKVLMELITICTNNTSNSADFNEGTKRISEQIALSLLVEKLPAPVFFLKELDGYKDGSFVESSYFGATGASF